MCREDYFTDVSNEYWIKRNIDPVQKHWGETPGRAYSLKQSGEQIKQLAKDRLRILKIELSHHKKWWILAKYIKPNENE